MPLIKQYSGILQGNITATGNTLVINGRNSGFNTTYMLTPAGETTLDWRQNGTSADLSILNGSTIEKASLYWYSTVIITGVDDVSDNQDDPINFTLPTGTSVSVTPTFVSNTGMRLRIAEVTNLIQTGGSGTYTFRQLPTAINPRGLSSPTRSGWNLIVVYSNPNLSYKSISYDIGVQGINNVVGPIIDTPLIGFATPSTPPLKGYLLISAADGDPTADYSIVSVGSTEASLINIGNTVGAGNPNPGTKPNNPNNAFFSGQVNIADPMNPDMGLIDTRGTFGNQNHDAFLPFLGINKRNKWDLTMIDVSPTLNTNQTKIIVRTQVTGNNPFINLTAIGILIDINSPLIIPVKNVNRKVAKIGDILTYIISFTNSGTTAADNVIITDSIPTGITYKAGSMSANVSFTGDPTTAITLANSVEVGENVKISYQVCITTATLTPNQPPQNTNITYQFASVLGSPSISTTVNFNSPSILVYDTSRGVKFID